MSNLRLHLEGPMQSFGVNFGENRYTEFFPTKSAISGLCMSALGFDREAAESNEFLAKFNSSFQMIAVRVQKRIPKRVPMIKMVDFQTIFGKGMRRANGSPMDNPIISNREYLMDAIFEVILVGAKDMCERVGEAVLRPKRTLFLGRKCNIPSARIFAGIHDTYECLEDPLEEYDYQSDFKIDNHHYRSESYVRDICVDNRAVERKYVNRLVYTHYGCDSIRGQQYGRNFDSENLHSFQ